MNAAVGKCQKSIINRLKQAPQHPLHPTTSKCRKALQQQQSSLQNQELDCFYKKHDARSADKKKQEPTSTFGQEDRIAY